LGTEVNGSIAKPGEQDEYTFAGTVGQGLYLDSLGSSSNLTTKLISPSGTTVFDIPATNDRNPFFLTETGTYRILVDASGAVTGNYSFRLLDLGRMPTLSPNTTLTGNLSSPQAVSLYRLNATAGQKFSFSLSGDFIFGDAEDLANATQLLQISGGTEDGYDGINAALTGLSFRPGAAVNIILVTDEDRDIISPRLTFSTILQDLTNQQALLNAVVSANFRDTGNQIVLGVDSDNNAYRANGTGGYIITPIGIVSSSDTTKRDYIDLALATAGAAWNLDQLRVGGLTATSFTKAFVDIKAKEIIEQLPLTVIASDPTVSFKNLTGVVSGVDSGETATFNIELTSDGLARSFDLLFVRPGSSTILGSIPVTFNNDYFYLSQAIDPDNDTLTYSLLEAPTDATINPQSGQIHWKPKQGGNYQFSIQVDDGRGGRTLQDYTVTVNVGSPNNAPTITSVASNQAAIGRPYTYDIKATDPDQDILAYYLTQASDGVSLDRLTGRLTWTPTQPQLGNQTVKIRVLDGRGGETTQTLNLTVTPDLNNQEPQISSLPLTQIQEGGVYRYQIVANDGNGDLLTVDLPLKPDGMTLNEATREIIWQPTREQAGTHDLVIRIRDGYGGLTLQSFQITVNSLNNAPIITSNPDLEAIANLPYQYQVEAQDSDGDSLSYRLENAPNGMTIDADTGLLTWTANNSQIGQIPVTIIVKDSQGAETRQTYTLNVVATAPNNTPEITSTPRNSVALGTSYFYTLNISDPDGDPLALNLQTAPTGMTLNQQGFITWTPEANQLGNHTVKVQVNDGRGGFIEQEWAIAVVSQRSNNQAPQILSTPSLKANINQVYQYNLVGNDPDGDPIFWSLETRPQGMSLDVTKGTIRWQPKFDQIGLHEVVIQVIDTQGATSSQRFTLAVNGVNLPPNITSVPFTRTVTNQTYTYTVVAKDPENGILTYNLGRKPNGMTIDQTGKIQWTPTQIGNYDIDVLVTDNQGATTTQNYQLVVGTQIINQAPNITSKPLFIANVGNPYQYQIQASDPDGQSLTYQLIESPQGMTINTNTGLVQWNTPITGNYKVVVAAFDSLGLGVTQGYNLTAKVNSLPVIRSTTPPTGAVPGVPYRYDIQATDPDGGILTYSLDPASQAKGITLDESGRLSWTPSNSQTGIHAITLTITDAAGGKVTQSFNLTVAPDTTAPKVIINRNKNFTNKGEAVSFQVSATDNVGIANLQLLINNTPVVIDSNGVATFTPTNPGIITAKAFASDAAGNKAEATTTVNVLDPTDTEAPSVSLDLSGIANYEITAPTPIKGSVNDTNLAYYALEVAPADGSAPFKEMFRGTTPVTNGVLGVLDPTLLPNDTYQVRLVAYDVNGKGNGVAELLDVSGDLKLGNFQLSFTDLEIPVGGIPITLTRTYNTLNSNNKDDFGFGWRMEFRDADVRTSLPKDELYEQLGFRSVGFKEGDAVYLTLPGGKREKFTLKLEAINSLVNAFLGRYGLYKPTFVADKGSTSTLSVETAGVVLTRGQNGQVVPFSGGSAFAHYHPQDWGNYYQLTTKEGIVYNIDATTGDINSITNRNSDKLTFTDAGITSSNGLKVTFGRDTQGRITTVTDPMGKQIKYEYDSKGDLIKVTDRENNTTQFKYNNDQPHYLDEIIDPLGRTGIKNEYDENGRLTKVFNGEGKAVQLEYNPDNFVYSVKDPLGNSTTYESDARGNIITEIDANGGIIKRTYDDSNNLLSETNPEGEKLSYTYDSKGNKLSETDALGNVTRYNYNSNNDLLTTTDALGNVTTNTYDSRGNLLSITGLSNGTVTLAYNNNGLLTQLTTGEGTTKYEYDFRGNITKEINPLGHEITYTYDGNGNRLTETRKLTTANGIRTLVTKTEYDSKGNIIKVTDAEGNISQTIYDAAGQKIKEIDALGRVTKYVYSEGGQLLETIYPDATPHNDSDNPRTRKEYDAANRVTADIDELGRPTQYQYDALGRLIYTIYPDLTPNDNTDNPRKETRYDKAGRVIAEVDERGNITRYTYDDAGRRTETILPDSTPNNDTDNPRILVTYNALGRQISQTDHLGRKTQFVYDNLGRPTGQIFADNTSISSTFDQAGRVIAKIDQEGNKTKYEYNALGQLTAVIDALNNRTEYGYDELENLITQKDAKANITKYEYDGIGRRIATQLPLNQHSTTQYDQVGNIVSTTDFNGEIITFIYDERNRLIKKALPNNEQVIYTYTLTGQRATETDGNGTITYQYDSRDRLLSRIDPDGVKIEYTYDAAGNRTSVNIPSGKTSYTFDEQNRLKTVTDFSNGVTNYTYDLAGNLSKTTLPNGTIETRDYDLLNRLLYLQNSNSTSIINSFRYTLDKVGNRLTVVEQDGRKSNYEYDDLYRLLEEEVIDGTTRTISYTYDAVSNRLTRNDSVEGNTTYQYDKNDRLLKEVTNGVTTNYTYDNNGNTLSKTTGTDKVNYQWNAENRLVGLDNNGDGVNEITNKYDSDGIRISQIVNGEETRFLVDKNRDYAQVLEEYTPSKIIKASYIYGNDLISQLRNNQRSFYHVDGLGSTRALTDINGLVSDRYAYEAFGEIIKQLGNTKNLYLFAGEQRDPNLGLDYLRARYLDVSTGRFYGRDPFAGIRTIPLSLHRYLYGHANPVINIDPSGNVTIVGLNLGGFFSTSASFLGGNIARITVNNIAGKTFERFVIAQLQRQFGKDAVFTGVRFTGPGGIRVADAVIKLGDRLIIIETKTKIPLGGSSLARLGGQIKTFSLGTPSNPALRGLAQEVVVITEQSAAAAEASFAAIEAKFATGSLSGVLQGSLELTSVLRTLLIGL
jgi:RHS repeat-associated protein